MTRVASAASESPALNPRPTAIARSVLANNHVIFSTYGIISTISIEFSQKALTGGLHPVES